VSNAGHPITVILADDHAIVRAGVRRVLEAQPGIAVVAEAGDGDEAIAACRSTRADVLVLDLSMPGLDGLEVLRRVKAEHPHLKVLVLTMHAGRAYVTRAVQHGADGYLLKDSAVHDLVTAISAVTRNQPFYSPSIQQHMADELRTPRAEATGPMALTAREREVLTLLVQGLSSKEIGVRLAIGTRTVESHRANLMRKLEVKSSVQLAHLAIREGLVETPPDR
jgi:DNA-binding NarL/FixJ family response regulator